MDDVILLDYVNYHSSLNYLVLRWTIVLFAVFCAYFPALYNYYCLFLNYFFRMYEYVYRYRE